MIRNNVNLIGVITSPITRLNKEQIGREKFMMDVEVEGWKGIPEHFPLSIYSMNKNIKIDLEKDYTGKAFIMNGYISGTFIEKDGKRLSFVEICPREMQIVDADNIAQAQFKKKNNEENQFPFDL